MRVLFITRKFPPSVGGMETLSKGLADHLPEVSDLRVLSWGGSQAWLPWVFASFWLKGTLLMRKTDVVLLGDAVLSPLGWWFRRVHKKPVVSILHGLDMTFPNPVHQALLRAFSTSFDAYVCNSEATKREAERRGYGPLTVIHPGIDSVELFEKTKARALFAPIAGFKPHANAFVVGFLGRASERKGLPWFLRNVFPHLPEHVHLLIAGTSAEEDVVGLLSDPSLMRRVHVLGRISDHARELFFPSLDLFVMPNVDLDGDQEGFGIVATEATVRGAPVLASDLEGLKDAVLQDRTGWLITPGDADAFVETIRFLASDTGAERLDAVRRSAARATLEAFSWPDIARSYEDLLSRVTSSSRHRPMRP